MTQEFPAESTLNTGTGKKDLGPSHVNLIILVQLLRI